MKERGIIFNAEMVRAILDGRKTQTRRVMKVQPVSPELELSRIIESTRRIEDGKFFWREPGTFVNNRRSDLFSCPFGQPGDRLWVRETHRVHSRATDVATLAYRASERQSWTQQTHRVPIALCDKPVSAEKWTPSIHMPRWASRITLEITGVRVDRLQDISEADAAAEGVPPAGNLLPDYPGTYLTPKGDFSTAKVAFQRLWESIYGEESWQANPWVWVVEFKRVEVQP